MTMPEYQPFAVLPICGTSEINSFSSTKQESTLPGPALDKQRYQHTAIPYQHQHYTYGQPEPALVGQHYQQHTIPPQDQPYEQAGPALVGQHYQQHTTPPQHQAYVQAGPALVGHHYEQPPIPLHHQHHGHKPNLMMHPSQVEQPCLDQPFAVLPTCNTGEIGYFSSTLPEWTSPESALVGHHFQQPPILPQHQVYEQAEPVLVGQHYQQLSIPPQYQHHGHEPNLMIHPIQVEKPCLDQPLAVLPTCNTGEISSFSSTLPEWTSSGSALDRQHYQQPAMQPQRQIHTYGHKRSHIYPSQMDLPHLHQPISSFSMTTPEWTPPGPTLDVQQYQQPALPHQHQQHAYGQAHSLVSQARSVSEQGGNAPIIIHVHNYTNPTRSIEMVAPYGQSDPHRVHPTDPSVDQNSIRTAPPIQIRYFQANPAHKQRTVSSVVTPHRRSKALAIVNPETNEEGEIAKISKDKNGAKEGNTSKNDKDTDNKNEAHVLSNRANSRNPLNAVAPVNTDPTKKEPPALYAPQILQRNKASGLSKVIGQVVEKIETGAKGSSKTMISKDNKDANSTNSKLPSNVAAHANADATKKEPPALYAPQILKRNKFSALANLVSAQVVENLKIDVTGFSESKISKDNKDAKDLNTTHNDNKASGNTKNEANALSNSTNSSKSLDVLVSVDTEATNKEPPALYAPQTLHRNEASAPANLLSGQVVKKFKTGATGSSGSNISNDNMGVKEDNTAAGSNYYKATDNKNEAHVLSNSGKTRKPLNVVASVKTDDSKKECAALEARQISQQNRFSALVNLAPDQAVDKMKIDVRGVSESKISKDNKDSKERSTTDDDNKAIGSKDQAHMLSNFRKPFNVVGPVNTYVTKKEPNALNVPQLYQLHKFSSLVELEGSSESAVKVASALADIEKVTTASKDPTSKQPLLKTLVRDAVVVYWYAEKFWPLDSDKMTLRKFVDDLKQFEHPEAQIIWWQGWVQTVAVAACFLSHFPYTRLKGLRLLSAMRKIPLPGGPRNISDDATRTHFNDSTNGMKTLAAELWKKYYGTGMMPGIGTIYEKNGGGNAGLGNGVKGLNGVKLNLSKMRKNDIAVVAAFHTVQEAYANLNKASQECGSNIIKQIHNMSLSDFGELAEEIAKDEDWSKIMKKMDNMSFSESKEMAEKVATYSMHTGKTLSLCEIEEMADNIANIRESL